MANIHPLSRPLGQALESPFNAQTHCCGEIHNKNNTRQALLGSQFEDPAHHSREVMTAEVYGSRPQSMLSREREVKGGLAYSLCNPRTYAVHIWGQRRGSDLS